MVIKTCIFTVFVGIVTFSFGSYNDYSLEIRLAQKDFISLNYEKALDKYINTLEKYQYPYLEETMQAAYISCYTGEKELFKDLIFHCTKLGMTESEYESLKTQWEILNKDDSFEFQFQKFRLEYLNNINWIKITGYLKLDIYRTYIINTFPLKENNHDAYYEQMNLLRDRYIELISLYGYVNDKDTGRRFKIKQGNCKKSKTQEYYFLKLEEDPFMLSYFKNTCLKVNVESSKSIWSSSDPGAWFLSHYVNGKNIIQIDTTFFNLILKGMDNLQASPYLVVNMLESTRTLANDFALTYYSRVWLGIKMGYWDKYNLGDLQKNTINTNRIKYGFRTLEEEEKLLRHLYFLKTKKQLSEKFTNKDIEVISFENRIFIQVMV